MEGLQSSDSYQGAQDSESSRYNLQARDIFGLIIWIGSLNRFELMEQQALILQNGIQYTFNTMQMYIILFFKQNNLIFLTL